MLQLRVQMPQLKILHAATKTWCSQINIKIIFKGRRRRRRCRIYANLSLWNSTKVFKTFKVFAKYSCFWPELWIATSIWKRNYVLARKNTLFYTPQVSCWELCKESNLITTTDRKHYIFKKADFLFLAEAQGTNIQQYEWSYWYSMVYLLSWYLKCELPFSDSPLHLSKRDIADSCQCMAKTTTIL